MMIWQVCEDCGEDWCNLHGMHAKECPCPMHCEWKSDPLVTGIDTLKQAKAGWNPPGAVPPIAAPDFQ